MNSTLKQKFAQGPKRRVNLGTLGLAIVLLACGQSPAGGQNSTGEAGADDSRETVSAEQLARLDEWAAGLRSQLSPEEADTAGLREVLDSGSGRLALADEVAAEFDSVRAVELGRALDAYTNGLLPNSGLDEMARGDAGRERSEWLKLREEADKQLELLRPFLAKASASLDDTADPVERQVKVALQGELGAELALVSLVLPAEQPIRREISHWFSVSPTGQMKVAPDRVESVESALPEANRLQAAIDDGVRRLRSLSDSISAQDDLHRRTKEALKDPVFAASLAGRVLRSGQVKEASELGPAMAQAIIRNFEKSNRGQLRLASKADPAQLASALDRYDREKAVVSRLRASAERLLSGDARDDSITSTWKTYLRSDAGLLAAAQSATEMPQDPVAVFLEQTSLGRSIAREGGDFRINPFLRLQAAEGIEKLAQLRRDRLNLLPRFERLASIAKTPEWKEFLSDPMGQLLLTDRAQLDSRSEFDALENWTSNHLSRKGGRFVVREGKGEAMGRLQSRASALRTAVREETSLNLDVRSLPFNQEHLGLFRASVFFNPRTPLGERIYHSAYTDHEAARIFGLFEWSAVESTDLNSFIENLRKHEQSVEALAADHRKLIVMINFMPSWLSRSNDDSQLEGHWKARNAYAPRDWSTWAAMVKETVAFMNRFASGPEHYYEVWNEPDGGYWRDDSKAYFELYQKTARTIRAADPNAKIGGAGVNQWDGRFWGEKGSTPLNLQLIRFAASSSTPLDFISWHQFGRPVSAISEAKEAYAAEFRKQGLADPEYLVTEWTVPVPTKGSELAAAAFAEHMFAFYEAGVDIQTFAAWEEFDAEPDPNGNGPYGLITQKGESKPPYYVHQFFDRLSQNSQGIATATSDDKTVKAVISKKSDNEFEIVAWDLGLAPPLEAAVKALRARGVSQEQLRSHGSMESLENSIALGRPLKGPNRRAFEAARVAYQSQTLRRNVTNLVFPGRVAVLDAASVKGKLSKPLLVTEGPRLLCAIDSAEVVWIRVRID